MYGFSENADMAPILLTVFSNLFSIPTLQISSTLVKSILGWIGCMFVQIKGQPILAQSIYDFSLRRLKNNLLQNCARSVPSNLVTKYSWLTRTHICIIQQYILYNYKIYICFYLERGGGDWHVYIQIKKSSPTACFIVI